MFRIRRSLEEWVAFLIDEAIIQENGCWDCHLMPNAAGYSNITYGGRIGIKMRAHRLIYSQMVGPIPEGLWVLHSCDNRRCINPEHLFVGTEKDNTQDMLRKGRDKQGSNRKVTLEMFTVMHCLTALGMDKFQVAEHLKVTYETVRVYLKGQMHV